MENEKYHLNRCLGTDYLKLLAPSIIKKAKQSDQYRYSPQPKAPIIRELLLTHNIDYPLTSKQFHYFNDPNTNIMLAFQKGKFRATKATHQLKKLMKYLFTLRDLTGHKNTQDHCTNPRKYYLYTVLIDSKKMDYRYNNGDCLDPTDRIAEVNFKNAISELKKSLNKKRSKLRSTILKHTLYTRPLLLKFLDTSIVSKFNNSITPTFPHVHGLLIGSKVDPSLLSNVFSAYLSSKLGYSVSCSVKYLCNKALTYRIEYEMNHGLNPENVDLIDGKKPVVITPRNFDGELDDGVLYSKQEHSEDLKALRTFYEDTHDPHYLEKIDKRIHSPYYPIAYFMIYINKTNKLAFLGGGQGRGIIKKYKKDFDRWEKLSTLTKKQYIKSCLDIKQHKNKTYVEQLGHYYDNDGVLHTVTDYLTKAPNTKKATIQLIDKLKHKNPECMVRIVHKTKATSIRLHNYYPFTSRIKSIQKKLKLAEIPTIIAYIFDKVDNCKAKTKTFADISDSIKKTKHRIPVSNSVMVLLSLVPNISAWGATELVKIFILNYILILFNSS